MRTPATPNRLARAVAGALVLLALLCAGGAARAHSTTFSVYSKYEATVLGERIAFVLALDKAAVLQLLERDAAHEKVLPEAIGEYRPFFSKYVFERLTVTADGAACTHPAELAQLFWDARTGRVVAVTTFACAAPPKELTIRALVAHDMPIAHELVGDLKYGTALERSFFYDDELEAHLSLPALAERGDDTARAPRRRGKFSYVATPDRERRYDDLARAALGATEPAEAAVDVRPSATLLHFIGQGVFHIFTGYDHVLFIVTLMLSVSTWKRLAIIVTSFTAAHSITLVLATLGVVSIPSRVVEPLIALSVLVVAADALLRPKANARAVVTFAFGLLHGFGLSNVLRDLGLTGRELVPALLGFNVGVELGQLAIVAPLFPLVLYLRKREKPYERARSVLCASVAVLAVLWIALRVREAFVG